MRRTAGILLLLASLGGCMSVDTGGGYGPPGGGGHAHGGPGGPSCGSYGMARAPMAVPGVQGAYGTPVPMSYPYAASPPSNPMLAQQMMNNSVPLNMVQMHNPMSGSHGSGIMQASASSYPGADPGLMQASGMPPMPMFPGGNMLSPPGLPFAPPLPGMGSPNPGANGAGNIMPTSFQPPPGAVPAVGALPTVPTGLRFPVSRTQVQFRSPIGMKVSWYNKGPDGKESYSPYPIETPGRYNFLQAAVYRLKLTNIPGNPGLEVYPTLEVVPANTRTEAFLAHSSVPVTFTPQDFKQVVAGNYVVKVIYLPDPQYQEVAFTGPGEIVSTQLEPGANPIEEAQRRGSILLVIRMGNMDQQAPNTPRIDTPGAGGMPFGPGPGMMMPGMVPPLAPQGPFIGGPAPGMPLPGMPGKMPFPGANPMMPNGGMPPFMPQPPYAGTPPFMPQAPFSGMAPNAPQIPHAPAAPELPVPPPLPGKAGVAG